MHVCVGGCCTVVNAQNGGLHPSILPKLSTISISAALPSPFVLFRLLVLFTPLLSSGGIKDTDVYADSIFERTCVTRIMTALLEK